MTDLYLFDSGQLLTMLSIALPLVWEEWRPSLLQVATSGGESRLAAVRPSLLGVAPSRPVASTAAAAAVMGAIPVATMEVGLEVTLAIPPPTATIGVKRETEHPGSLGGGTHSSPSWSELEVSGGDMARLEGEHPPMGREVEVAEVPYSGEAGASVEPPVIPSSQELAVVR